MAGFQYNFRLNNVPVNDSLGQAFKSMLTMEQDIMQRLALDFARLQGRIEELTQQNTQLRLENTKLKEDNSKLNAAATAAHHAQQVQAVQARTLAKQAGIQGPPGIVPEAKASAPVRAGGDGSIFKLVKSVGVHEAPVHSVAMQKGTSKMASASWDSTVKLYDLSTNSVVGNLSEFGQDRMGGLYSVAFSKTEPDILGCTSCDRHVYLWNHTTGALLNKLAGHTDEVNGIDFHAEQQVMCTASDDCKVIIWDFHEGMILRQLEKHTKPAYGCVFLGSEHGADQQYLMATCCFDRTTRVFDMRDKSVVAQLKLHNDDVIGIRHCGTTNLLATGSDDGHVGIYDIRTWGTLHDIDTRKDLLNNENEVKRVTFSPDGTRIAAACSSGLACIYDIGGGSPGLAGTLAGHTDCVFDVAWSKDLQTNKSIIVTASHDNTCRYWRQT